tara:strand:- start:650 stop:979 length:330 start_codon:yes stop_codon:yes gene_type:complete
MSDTIYGDILAKYSDANDSMAKLISQHCIQARDFVVLSTVCDQGLISIDRLAELFGFDQSTVKGCTDRLQSAQLLTRVESGESVTVHATANGMLVARRFDADVTPDGEA